MKRLAVDLLLMALVASVGLNCWLMREWRVARAVARAAMEALDEMQRSER